MHDGARDEHDGLPIRLLRGWMPAHEADALWRDVVTAVPWATRHLRMFGRVIEEPRRSAWLGDPGAVYTWSGRRNEPAPWVPALREVADRLEALLGQPFNSVLCNLYRDGDDTMGMHADDEPELGPLLASLSLGATRTFRVRPVGEGPRADLRLAHGDLLVLDPAFQVGWRHGVPRERGAGARINLTFRWIVPGAQPAARRSSRRVDVRSGDPG